MAAPARLRQGFGEVSPELATNNWRA